MRNQKHGTRQSIITEFTVVKRKSNNFQKLSDDANQISPPSSTSKHVKCDDCILDCCCPSIKSEPEPRSGHAMEITESAGKSDSDRDQALAEDIEMHDLQQSFTQTLGKRLKNIYLDDDDEEPLAKRQKQVITVTYPLF
ncbi:unnamed protein product [Gongylonema pulchrum]|uniref:Uncharacterized protein n=1 Tax=Gongylonema pulchrum TaxID=637853 RepID=A0A183CVJ2_9BILA|nr:unnamed protein product [Gongylonema pulchrum]